jgi:hypothetical protein
LKNYGEEGTMDLKKIREDIDLLDSRILNLLNGRMELALMAKKLKHQIEDVQREKEVLDVFARERINLTRIESIPVKPGDYVFILDFVGSIEEIHVVQALTEVEKITQTFRVLGCYSEKKVFS